MDMTSFQQRVKMPPTRLDLELIEAAHSRDRVLSTIGQLTDPRTRVEALIYLSSNVMYVDDIGRLLWLRPNSLEGLLSELRSITNNYACVNLPTYQFSCLNQVLSLIYYLAAEPDFRIENLEKNIPELLKPLLCKVDPGFSKLSVQAWKCIHALITPVAEKQVVVYLFQSGIITLCLNYINAYCQLDKSQSAVSVIVCILYHILKEETGLEYICQTYDGFINFFTILNNSIEIQDKPDSILTLKYIIGCFLCLAKKPKTHGVFKSCLSDKLWKIAFSSLLENENELSAWLLQLFKKIEEN